MLQRLLAEQESTKSLLVANRALQSSVDQSEGHLKAARAHCVTLQSQASFVQSHYQHLEGHLACVTDRLQRQPDGSEYVVDVAALVSQVWTYRHIEKNSFILRESINRQCKAGYPLPCNCPNFRKLDWQRIPPS